jgi:outer membrane protein OmpA-like peptidoglycan-associated protein
MRLRASVAAIGLALGVAAPLYAQSAGAIEIGGFGRMQWHDKQLLLPDAVTVADPNASTADFTKSSAYGFGGRLGFFFAENWSVEGGYHFVRQPSIKNTNLSLRVIWNRPITGELSYAVGAGVLSNSYTLAPYTGVSKADATGAAPRFFGGADGISDFGVAGLLGARYMLTDMFSIRLDGTASVIPAPSARRIGSTGNASGIKPDGADLNLGVELGGSVLLNNEKDADGDGVKDKADACPNTPKDVKVDEKGCPVDSDGDRVADYLDKCPNTPKGVSVDSNGCPVDSDKDGVADYLDKCPGTPAGVRVDNNGCPLDSDKDGVTDNLDKCPNTPAGVKVDASGCPIDTDKDGVADYLDKCPNTAAGVKVDANGCALDNDGDGVVDSVDKCLNTPPGVQVDKEGCPVDTDKDGVPDYLDKCPNTKAGSSVDARGCTRVFEEGSTKIVLKGVTFATGTARLTPNAKTILDGVAVGLVANTDVKVEVGGHTDNVGNAKSNTKLSQARADAVKAYLASKGVPATNLTARGYGPSEPAASNKTRQGREQNRRVELKKIP